MERKLTSQEVNIINPYWKRSISHAFFAWLFLVLISQFSIKLTFSPIPITLQSFGIFVLILCMGRTKSIYAILLYLASACLGFPVFPGGVSDAWWILDTTAGYLLGFIAAAWISGTLLERKEPSFIWSLFSLSWGLACILFLGATWLAFSIGIQDAFYFGIVPILPGGLLKLIAAAALTNPIKRIYGCSHLSRR